MRAAHAQSCRQPVSVGDDLFDVEAALREGLMVRADLVGKRSAVALLDAGQGVDVSVVALRHEAVDRVGVALRPGLVVGACDVLGRTPPAPPGLDGHEHDRGDRECGERLHRGFNGWEGLSSYASGRSRAAATGGAVPRKKGRTAKEAAMAV